MIWWVHRNGGPGTAISWAGQYEQTGYADEQLDDATSEELQAFLNLSPTAEQIYQEKLDAGIVVTSSGTPALNATYALDPTTLDQIGSVARDFGSGLGLPRGLSTFSYPDISGIPHVFTGADIQNLYKAMRDLVDELDVQLAASQAGATPVWPAQTATIP